MSRRYIDTSTPIGAVRRYFGLSQDHLAMFLEVSKALIGHIELGRRELSLLLRGRLLPLLRHLPPAPIGRAEMEEYPATAPAPAVGPIQARRKVCLLQAILVRDKMRPLLARAVYASRWQQALPVILAEMTVANTLDEQEEQAPLRAWLQAQGRKFRESHAAQYHLLRVQAEALEAEAAALALLLPPEVE